MNERVLTLGTSQPVVSILTEPAASDANRPAVILSNSGIVHRVGPGRLYVRLARRLAELGFVVARIDHRGIGDSESRRDGLPFFHGAKEELREVMDDLGERYGISKFVIMGICSGADLSFSVGGQDERVVGVVLINGGGLIGHPDWMKYMQARLCARRYWSESIFRPDRWVRLITGRIQYRSLLNVLFRQAKGGLKSGDEGIEQHVQHFKDTFQQLVDRGTRVLMLHSSDDESIDHRDVILGDRLDDFRSTGRFRDGVIADADHTFTLLQKQRELSQVIESWVQEAWCSVEGAEAAAGGVG